MNIITRICPASCKLAGHFYVRTAEAPAVYFSVLASSVIIMAAMSGLLPPLGIPALGFRLHITELLSDTLFFRRRLRWMLLSVDLPLPCGEITVVLLYEDRSLVIQPLESSALRRHQC